MPDALASTANFLRKAGWAPGQPWGYEVRLPANYRGPSGRTRRAPLARYAKLGITRIDGAALQGSGRAGLILPAGPKGPAFLVFGNFDALYSYNNADPMRLRFRTCRIASGDGRRWRRRGPPTIPVCRAANGASWGGCSSRGAMTSANPMAGSAR